MFELEKGSEAANQALWDNEYFGPDGREVVMVASVNPLNSNRILFSKLTPAPGAPARWVQALISIRAISLTATVTPVLVTYLAGSWILGWVGSWFELILIVLSVAFLQVAINIQNDVEDHVSLVDRPGDIGGSGVIQKGWFTARQLQKAARACFGVSVALGVWPVLQQWQILLPFAILSALLAWSYSGIGIRLKAKALGDAVVFLLCGPMITVGASLALFGRTHLMIWGIGFVFGLGAVGILHANNLNDLEIDRERGAKTLANQMGFLTSKRYLAGVYAAIGGSLAFLFWGAKAPIWFSVSPLLAMIPATLMCKRVFEASGPLSPQIHQIRFQAAQIHLLIGIIWIVGFGVTHGLSLGVGL